MNKRSHLHKKADSSASNPVLSQFQSRPFIAQAKPQSEKPLTQTQTENQEFQQQKFEATKLNLQVKYGTITPEGQERLTEVQAKMSGLLQRRLEHASSNGSNFANIPISRPDAPSQLAVQTKLTIGKPGDKFEIAADKAAEDFVTRYHDRAPVSQQAQQNLPEDKSVEEKELQRKLMLQLRSAKVGMTAAPEVEAAIKQARGGGQSMPEKTRKPYEQHAGADYSRVKIHTDRRADLINRWIGAEACAMGTDVFMRRGNYRPGTKKGDELLRHELEHVGQQKGSEVQAKPERAQRTTDKVIQRMNAPHNQAQGSQIDVFKADNREQELNKIVWQDHQNAIQIVCEKYHYTIAIRETGALSIKRIAEGAKAKPHTILEKSIKKSSIERGHGTQADEELKKLQLWDLDGFVGHWDAKNELIGVRIDKLPNEVKEELERMGQQERTTEQYVKETESGAYVPLKLNQEGGGPAIQALKRIPDWKKYLYTGDYDLHEAYKAGLGSGKGGQIMEASPEKINLINRLNKGIGEGSDPYGRSGEAKLEGEPERVHVEGAYAMFQHGDQATYRMNQHLEAKEEGRNVARLVRTVAHESDEPLAWCVLGEWYVTMNKREHEVLRRELKITKPHTWSEEDDERMKKVGKWTEEYHDGSAPARKRR